MNVGLWIFYSKIRRVSSEFTFEKVSFMIATHILNNHPNVVRKLLSNNVRNQHNKYYFKCFKTWFIRSKVFCLIVGKVFLPSTSRLLVICRRVGKTGWSQLKIAGGRGPNDSHETGNNVGKLFLQHRLNDARRRHDDRRLSDGRRHGGRRVERRFLGRRRFHDRRRQRVRLRDRRGWRGRQDVKVRLPNPFSAQKVAREL